MSLERRQVRTSPLTTLLIAILLLAPVVWVATYRPWLALLMTLVLLVIIGLAKILGDILWYDDARPDGARARPPAGSERG